MHLGLEKKVVLVTGGTKGIGKAIVECFLQEGAIVHFCSRTEAQIQAANERLAKAYPYTLAKGAVVDVGDEQQLSTWINAAAKEHGRLDVVVPNVSCFQTKDQSDHWAAMFKTDVMGAWNMIQTALLHLEATKGNIVFISSVSGRDIDFTAPGPYGAIKAGMTHYVQQLAYKLAPKGIRANICSPGNTYSKDGPFGEIEEYAPELFESQLKLNPMGRYGKPEEIANAVVFLASERASFVSGTNFVVDGALCTGIQL